MALTWWWVGYQPGTSNHATGQATTASAFLSGKPPGWKAAGPFPTKYAADLWIQQNTHNGIFPGTKHRPGGGHHHTSGGGSGSSGGGPAAPPGPAPAPSPPGPSPPGVRPGGAGAAQPGDLACWGPNQHMGIVTGPNQMVSALDPSQGTAITAITAALGTPPVILRLRAVQTAGSLKGNQGVAALLAAGYGWAPGQDKEQWQALVRLWGKESGWSVTATNPSGAYGIPQAQPGDKMAAAGPDWRTSARTQIKWGLDYIADTYGDPAAAWRHEQAHGWY